MKKCKILVIIAFILTICIVGFGLQPLEAKSQEDSIKKQQKLEKLALINSYNENYGVINNYYKMIQEWNNENLPKGNEHFTLTPDLVTGGILSNETYGYETHVLYIEPGDTITFQIDVKAYGLYQLFLDYYVLEDTRVNPSISVLINGETQYTEMYDIDLLVEWEMEKDKRLDRYGDEMTPKSHINPRWMINEGLYDPNYFFTEPLQFKFNEGLNEISITLKEGYLLLGNIEVMNQMDEIKSYEDYLTQYNSSPKNESLITLEAEDFDYKNSRSITSKYKRDPSVTPYSYKNRVLNVLDGDTFSSSGDRVTYSFEIEKTGLYQIAFKYYHNTNSGIPSHRRILIDHEIPFQEMAHYQFEHQTKWKNETLNQDGKAYQFYLTKGTHTITLLNDNVLVADVYHDLLEILDKINDISLDIHKITGGLVDRERDWKITKYITDLEERLLMIRDEINQAIDDVATYTKDNDLPIISELKIARNIIEEFIEDPEELPGYMSRFNEGDRSAYARINTILPQLLDNPIHLDKVYIYQETDLPKANRNIFIKLVEGVKAFFYSFFDPKYNELDEVDDETIEIWVNKSRLYVEIMQRMIDDEFTTKTGIKVQLSIMPDENKIILSNSAGTTPDGVIGATVNKPFEFALRSIIEDLSQYDGFYELAEEFNPNTFIPYIYEDGVYAIPETQDVNLLFYRKDILNQLGLEPPETWTDVVTMLPVLQKYDMNFYSPIGNNTSLKGFGQLTPHIYQYGGALYDNETMNTIVNQGGAYQAFEFMTDLFTVYNLPVQTSNFFQHFRTGKIPVGIMGAGTYIQLKYAAPELAGQWDVLPIPGMENEEGVIERWDPTYGSSSIIFSDSEEAKKNMTWELIKWWSSGEVQADFSYEIQSTLGERFLYMSANIEGFKDSAWPSDSKDVILQQWQWIQATGKVPGDYILEREMSNAWNRVVLDGMNPRISIDQTIITVNNEIHRKLREFGYMDKDGNMLKPYVIPTIENVEQWVRRDE